MIHACVREKDKTGYPSSFGFRVHHQNDCKHQKDWTKAPRPRDSHPPGYYKNDAQLYETDGLFQRFGGISQTNFICHRQYYMSIVLHKNNNNPDNLRISINLSIRSVNVNSANYMPNTVLSALHMVTHLFYSSLQTYKVDTNNYVHYRVDKQSHRQKMVELEFEPKTTWSQNLRF